MNKKSLVKIINKELTILTDIVNEFSNEGDVQPYETDMAISKLNDIYRQLLLLKETDNSNATKVPIQVDLPILTLASEKEVFKVDDINTVPLIEQQLESIRPKISLPDKNATGNDIQIIEKTIESTIFKQDDQVLAFSEIDNESLQKTETITELAPEQEAEEKVTEPSNPMSEIHHNEAYLSSTVSDVLPVQNLKVKDTPNRTTNKPSEISGEMAASETNPNIKGTIIADRFQNLSPSLNDMLSGINKNKDLASSIKERPIRNLKLAIKLNDRIWFTNELFHKNKTLFEKTIESVNQSANLDEALAYLFSNFNWDQNQKSTISFLELVFRRFAN